MQNKTEKPTQIVEQDKMPPLGPMTKEETEKYYKHWNQLIGLLADCTEEEMAAFDSTLRHPPPPDKSGVSSQKIANHKTEGSTMQDKASTLTETEDDKDALPRLGPLTKEESQALRQFWEEIIESLEDWTEEEMVAFDSTLRHPPPIP